MGTNKELIISAPGKLILHGEHAVVYGRRALAASLNIRTFLRLRECCSGKVKLELPDVDISAEWTLSDLVELKSKLEKVDIVNPGALSEKDLSALKRFAKIDEETIETRHLALVAFLHLFTSIIPDRRSGTGYEIRVGSRLPPGAGLGSSAAYSTCLAAGFLLLNGQVSQATTPAADSASSFSWTDSGDLELINRWAFQSEKILHGKPSGIDNSVSTFGGTVIFHKGQITSLEAPPQLDILLTNTKVPRSTKLLVAGVAERHARFPDVIEPVLDAIEEITKKCEQVFAGIKTDSKGTLNRAYSDLGELIEVNQHLLAALGVSHPALAKVCHLSETHGLRAKLTGAGGGGCAFTLIPPGTEQADEDGLVRAIRDAGFECWRTQIGSPGVTFHSASSDIELPTSFH